MSTFRNEMEIVVDGETFKVTTRAVDYTNAELQLSKEGGQVDQQPVALRFRVTFLAFRRAFPDHDLARSFGRWLDVLDDITEEADVDGVERLDPTQPADSDA